VRSYKIIDNLDLNHIIRQEKPLWDHFWEVLNQLFFFYLCLSAVFVLADDFHLKFSVCLNLSAALQVLNVFLIKFDFYDARPEVVLGVKICEVGPPNFKLEVNSFQKNVNAGFISSVEVPQRIQLKPFSPLGFGTSLCFFGLFFVVGK
jgi:hypothetical protein